MDYNNPVVLGDGADAGYSDDRSYINQTSARLNKIPLLDQCSFCKNPLYSAIGRVTGFRMLLYISFIYLMPVFILWSKHSSFLGLPLCPGTFNDSIRNLSFLPGGPSLRFSSGFTLALFLLFSELVELYCYIMKYVNIYIFGSSTDDFFYDGSNGIFGGRDVETTDVPFGGRGSESINSYSDFMEWFNNLSLKLKYIHVFHHLRWVVMFFLLVTPQLYLFIYNVSYYDPLASSPYFVEIMDFALGLLLPLTVILICNCIIYPTYLIIATIIYKFNNYYSILQIPHSLPVLCLQDACPCEHLVKEQVSAVVRQSLKFHSIHLGIGKLFFTFGVCILFIISFISIFFI